MSLIVAPFATGLWPTGTGLTGASSPAAWSPSDLGANLVAWWKADGTLWQDAGTTPATADGDPVGRWEDASTSARHANQTTAGFRPLLKIVSGKNYIRFDGTDDLLTFTTADLAAFSVALVHTVTASAGQAWSGPVNWRTVSENGFQLVRDEGANTAYTPHLVVWNGAAESANKKRNAGSLGNGVALTQYLWTSTPILHISSADVAIANGATGFGFAGGAIGKGFDEFAGDIAEIIVCDKVLSAGEITSLEGYYATKWSVT